jgi:hypothetical protein
MNTLQDSDLQTLAFEILLSNLFRVLIAETQLIASHNFAKIIKNIHIPQPGKKRISLKNRLVFSGAIF